MGIIQPRWIRRVRLYGVVFVLLFVFYGQSEARETYRQRVASLADEATSQNWVRADLEDKLLQLTNAYRASKGKPPLQPNAQWLQAARAHATDMMLNNFVGHGASTGQDFESRMRALSGNGVLVLPQMGENAARVSKPSTVDSNMATKLFQQWVKSAGHRRNLLSRNYVSIAIGAVSRGGVLYANQIFVGPEVKTNFGQEGSGGIY